MLQQIMNDRWKEAYKARDMVSKSAFEAIKAKILFEEKSGKHTLPLSDEIIQNIIIKEVKELKETQSYLLTNSVEYTEIETKINVLSEYLPKQMSVDEVKAIVSELMKQETNKGKLIGLTVKEIGSRFDKSKIAQIVNDVISEVQA